MSDTKKQPRGFAALTPEQHRAIASSGGRAAHAQGTAHKFTPAEGRSAGQRGGATVIAKHGKSHMASIGSLGGKRSVEVRRKRKESV